MLHSSTKKLIDRLAEMTELGKLDWTEGDAGNVIYSTEGYSVLLPGSADEIVITSIDGKELERASASDLAVSQNEDGTSYSEIVATMAKEATRIALGTETAISTLLAGMEDPVDVQPEATEPPQEPEDPVNEATALTEDPPEALAEPETEEIETVAAPEVETEAESEAPGSDEPVLLADDAIEAEAEPVAAETSIEDAESEEVQEETDVLIAATPEETSSEDESSDTVIGFAVPEADDADENTSDADPDVEVETVAHDVAPTESESELTEAVARLADEVNGREESDDDSDIATAAASAVGAVALAAGLKEDTQDSAASDADEGVVSAETVDASDQSAPAEAVAPTSNIAYVPFGSEAISDDAPAESVAEASESESAAPEATEDSTETDPEVTDAPESSFVSVDAALETPETAPSFGALAAETEASPAPNETNFAAANEDEPAPEPAPEPVLSEAPVAEPTPPEPEAQSYSLSGIGAGFGLGALAAKTEASGIPGVSGESGEPEKIIIDATDDVLPEPEGQSNFSPLNPASTGISFGDTAKTESDDAPSSDAETEEDADILKPRTRFNPWD